MEADLQPLATSGVVTRISSYCANPANPPQSPHCPASGTTHPRGRAEWLLLAVCTENLNPDVVVMKSAKNGVRFDGAGPLNRARDRRILVQ
jgi:hypothetical protein